MGSLNEDEDEDEDECPGWTKGRLCVCASNSYPFARRIKIYSRNIILALDVSPTGNPILRGIP